MTHTEYMQSWANDLGKAGISVPATDSTVDDAIFLGCVAHDVVIAANDYGRAIADAQTLEQLATIKDALDESIGALLSQEQIAVRKREILELQRKGK